MADPLFDGRHASEARYASEARHAFETRLEKLFGEAPAFADTPLFAARLQARLDRGWALRRGLIGIAGLVGGALAAFQVARSHAFDQLGTVLRGWMAEAGRVVDSAPAFSHAQAALAQTLPFGADVLWPVAGLALLAAALLATRLLEDY